MRPDDVSRVFQTSAEDLVDCVTKGVCCCCCCCCCCTQLCCNLSPPEGAVIALELSGDGVVEACRSIARDVFSGTKVTTSSLINNNNNNDNKQPHTGCLPLFQVFVSDNKNTSSRDIDSFFNFADMQMGL